jgi:DNA-binding NarL/FixJ family response regulator
VRVLVVAEIRLYREGLARTLEKRDGVEAVAAASPSEDIGVGLAGFCPDVLLIDVLGTDKFDFIGVLTSRWPDLKVVALGVRDADVDILACAKVGAQGLIMREASFDELFEAIEKTLRGEFCWSPRATAALAKHVAVTTNETSDPLNGCRLTGRQTEILERLSAGLSNKEIARELGIELATVKNHVHQVLEKLGVQRRGEAVARVHLSGWTPNGGQ